jgi:hypothetical protein
MDILNFISWIKAGNYRATLPTDVTNLIPVAAKDPSRDDGYLPLAVNAAPLQSLYNTGIGSIVANEVTINAHNGVITTEVLSTAAGSYEDFTFINSNITPSSVILLTTQYEGAGFAQAVIANISTGTMHIRVNSIHSVDSIDGIVKIHFMIIN